MSFLLLNIHVTRLEKYTLKTFNRVSLFQNYDYTIFRSVHSRPTLNYAGTCAYLEKIHDDFKKSWCFRSTPFKFVI
jgi:hypothetical protein